jgi:hypothetical protein
MGKAIAHVFSLSSVYKRRGLGTRDRGHWVLSPLDLFYSLLHTDYVAAWPLTFISKEKLKCPAEENENCVKLPLTNAKKSCGKTDTRTNRKLSGCFFINAEF